MSSRTSQEVSIVLVDPRTDRRQELSRLLDGHGGLCVAGQAADTTTGRRLVDQLRPSLVLLDADLEGGPDLVRTLMTERPVPIVVLVAPGQRNSGPALTALTEGALSVQLRPGDGEGATPVGRFRSVLAALADVKVVRRRRPAGDRAPSPPQPATVGEGRPTGAIEVVAVGASTGGPSAIQRLLRAFPRELPVPILIVQHLAHGFAAHLVRSLQAASPLPVALAEHGADLSPGHVYLGPDGRHLTVTRSGRIRLHGEAPVSGFRPSATVLFASVAASHGPAAAAVILSGMGSDGLTGLRAVDAAGGRVLAQDQATSAVYGMPGAAVTARLADLVAPVEDLAAYITDHTRGATP